MSDSKFSDEYLVKCLKSYIDRTKKIPTKKEFQNHNKQVANAIANRWGWNNGIIKAGFKPRNIHVKPYKEFYKADFCTMLEMTKEVVNKFLLENDRLPKYKEFENLDMPYYRFYYEKFDCSYTEFLIEILGYDEEFLSFSST